eukprot:PLAT12501.6.p1 GENE.PLAT12501.6~~PLAT12501.6.p1  ORF type:complete len:549 (+),score=250.84 PLAT12501.6:377-2023(+)
MAGAIGVSPLWGSSPSLDLLSLLPDAHAHALVGASEEEAARPLRIALFRPGDIRHVLLSLSQRRKYNDRPVHFYIQDNEVGLLSRMLLLLSVALDWELSIRQRGQLFLELLGNSLVQERAARYVSTRGRELVTLLCDSRGPLASLVDMSALRFKHRDEMEQRLKALHTSTPFDIETLRDTRLRAHYGERYDYRSNLIDWDYQMSVKKVAPVINFRAYRYWRQTGVAFDYLDCAYSVPNLTMATYAAGKERGRSTLRRGFWGDIITGPYVAMGVATHSRDPLVADLFKATNKGTGSEYYRHHAGEIAMYNVLAMLHELESGEPYRMRKEHDVYSGLGSRERKLPEAEHAERPPDLHDAVDGMLAAAEAAEAKASDDVEDVVAGEADSGEAVEEEEEKGEEAEAETEAGSADSAPAESEEQLAARLQAEAAEKAWRIMEVLSGVKIFFVGGKVEDMERRSRFRNLFDLIYTSNFAAHHLKRDSFLAMLRPGGRVVAETAQFMVSLKPEEKAEYVRKLQGMTDERGLQLLTAAKDVDSAAQLLYKAADAAE